MSERQAQELAEDARRLKQQADEELQESLPILQEAVRGLERIKVNDLYEIKTISKPTITISKMMTIVCLLF